MSNGSGKIIAIAGSVLGKIAPSAIQNEVDEWLVEHITNPNSPPLDRSLSSSSSAAPADMVGDLKNAFDSEIDLKNDEIDDICRYIGKSAVSDLNQFVTYQNGYLDNSTPVQVAQSNSQLISSIIKVGTGTKLSIKVPSGYRIYLQYLNDDLSKAPGAGFFTSDTDVTTTKNYVAFSITKNPYSTSDTISISEAAGFNIYRAVTVDANNLTKRIDDAETDIGTSVHFVSNYGENNIDNLKTPGYYYVTVAGSAHVGGTLPPTMKAEDGTNGFLEVKAYYNFVTQTLVQFKSGKTFVRGANTSESLTFNPWLEISNPEVEPEPDPKITTRNLWTVGDIDQAGYIMIGTQGTELYPAGKYTISFDLACDEEYINFNIYGNGVQLLTKQLTPSANRYIIQINATTRIERIFIQTKSGSSSANTFQLTDIQFEKIWWSGHPYASHEEWERLPFTTPLIDHETTVKNALTEYKSNWEGKKIIFNGDSITQGLNIAGANSRTGYVMVCSQLLKFGTVCNYAIGGTRMAHVEGESECLVDRISEMDTDADVVFIMCNTNDYASQVPIGTDDSSDETTYKGALNTLFTWLKTYYVQKPIIISTMLTRKINYDGGVELPIKIEEYAQAVRDMVEKYHFILFDAYERSGMDLRTSPQDGTGITNDGLHPNQYGAELLGRKVAAFINAQ